MNFQVQEGASTPHHTQPIHTTYSYISPHRNYHTSTTSCTQQLTLILILSTIRICLLVSHMSKVWWITSVNPILGCRLPTQRQQYWPSVSKSVQSTPVLQSTPGSMYVDNKYVSCCNIFIFIITIQSVKFQTTLPFKIFTVGIFTVNH